MKESIPLLPTWRVVFDFGAPPLLMLGVPQRQTVRVAPMSHLVLSQRNQTGVSSGLCELWWREQNLVETSNLPKLIGLGFEAKDGMAANWNVGVYLISSLSALVVLLVGLLALSVYPIVGALLTIGGMALQLYAVAGLCGAPGFKTESRENWEEDRD
jgi:uncharacterized membrane protein YuzA (DUF378 family)